MPSPRHAQRLRLSTLVPGLVEGIDPLSLAPLSLSLVPAEGRSHAGDGGVAGGVEGGHAGPTVGDALRAKAGE